MFAVVTKNNNDSFIRPLVWREIMMMMMMMMMTSRYVRHAS